LSFPNPEKSAISKLASHASPAKVIGPGTIQSVVWRGVGVMLGRNGLLIGVAILVPGPSVVHAQLFGSGPVAVVNGEPIPRSLFDDAMKQRLPVVTPLTAAQQRQIREAIVALLVDETLVRQYLKKNAPSVDPAEVAKQMESLEKGLAGQNKTVAEYCKETKQTEAQVRANITLMLQWNAYAAQKVTP